MAGDFAARLTADAVRQDQHIPARPALDFVGGFPCGDAVFVVFADGADNRKAGVANLHEIGEAVGRNALNWAMDVSLKEDISNPHADGILRSTARAKQAIDRCRYAKCLSTMILGACREWF